MEKIIGIEKHAGKVRKNNFFLIYRIFFLDFDGEERQEPTQIPVDPEFPDFPDFSNSAKTIGTFLTKYDANSISFEYINHKSTIF